MWHLLHTWIAGGRCSPVLWSSRCPSGRCAAGRSRSPAASSGASARVPAPTRRLAPRGRPSPVHKRLCVHWGSSLGKGKSGREGARTGTGCVQEQTKVGGTGSQGRRDWDRRRWVLGILRIRSGPQERTRHPFISSSICTFQNAD